MKKSSNLKGFTLLEVMIALSIFSVGILAVVAMQARSVQGNAAAQRLTVASEIAQERMERIMALPLARFPTAAVSDVTNVGQYVVTETFADPPAGSGVVAADARWVTVDVSWNGGFGQAHNVMITFIKTQNMENSYAP